MSPNKSPTPRSVREELINDPVFMAREAWLKELYRTVGRDHEYTRMHLSQAKNETNAASLASPVPVQRSTKEVRPLAVPAQPEGETRDCTRMWL